jgi:exoribonuclease R
MKALADPDLALVQGLGAIRTQFQLPAAFPASVLAAAELAAKRAPAAHVDRTMMPFITLDPASSTDLDQAFSIEASGPDLLLHYAIADVAWFVDDDDAIDVEAWKRGTSQYLPDGKTSLYPPLLSEGAASLLPSGPRPAVIFTVRVAPDGSVKLDSAERAQIRSRAKLAYDSVRDDDLPAGFTELAARIAAAEDRRGAGRVDPPEQEVARRPDGSFALQFRPRLLSEERNAAMSLATNLAIADRLFANQTGLFRVMAEPDAAAVLRLRQTASAFGLAWADSVSLAAFRRTLDGHDPKQAAFMLAVRKAGSRALYEPYQDGVVPWHAAMAATYVHATAPLRRLADRYVIRATLAIMNGQPVPESVTAAFGKLPRVMARADALGGQIDRASIDLAEAVMLGNRTGESFAAIVTDTDDRGTRIQLRDSAVVARIIDQGLAPGDLVTVRLTGVDLLRREVHFELTP